ncbi:MAG: nitrilase-related carbon-nitrogen hydrolase, partial [Phocaeicola sp.]|nr:nitrilase-related carbon-nitrogen hydrolase [Phocaeicola sp.]
AVNRVGLELNPEIRTKGIQFWGNSFVAGPQGEILAKASNNEEQLMIVEVNLSRSEEVRRWWPFLRDRRIDEYGNLTKRFID